MSIPNTIPLMLKRGLKGPLNIFPLFFFHEALDGDWQDTYLEMARLEYKHFNSYSKNLRKAPFAYLSEQDLKILFFLEAGQSYERIMSSIKREEEVPIECLSRLESIAHSYQKRFIHQDSSFSSLTQAFISFFHGLIDGGDRGRKFMTLAEHYIEEAQLKRHDELPHPYCLLLKVLTQVGRGQWDLAAETLKSYADNYPGPHVYKVLIRLYEKLGMDELAVVFKEKREHLISQKDHHPLQWPLGMVG